MYDVCSSDKLHIWKLFGIHELSGENKSSTYIIAMFQREIRNLHRSIDNESFENDIHVSWSVREHDLYRAVTHRLKVGHARKEET